MGPKETAVRATLATRPAGLLYAQPIKVRHCFAGLFNGARQGHLNADGSLFVGKSESEWDWQEVWPQLKELGLVDYRLEERDAPGAVSGKTTKFHWTVTDKGRVVRNDDLTYYRALMDAMDADELPSSDAVDRPKLQAPR